MFLLNLMRYLRGYVWFEARGVFLERFLNLAARDRIPIWSGRKRQDVYTGCVYARNYKKLRKSARKTGTKLRVTQKSGVPFQRIKYRKRTGLLVGLAVYLLFVFGMSRFLWRIEVNGNETIQDATILTALEQMDIAPGTPLSSIDVRDCERKAILLLPELSWVALNIDGSALHVEVSESTPPPEMVDPDIPCNVVASEAGQIRELYVFEGQPVVEIGDTVLPGDLIVSGITQDFRGQSLFRHARAKVVAQTQPKLEVSVPLAQTEYRETGKTMRRGYLCLFGGELPLFLPWKVPSPYHVERSETPLKLFSTELPVSWLWEEYVLMEEVPVTLTEEQAKAEASRELALLQKARLDDAKIVSREITGRLEGDHYTLRGSYVCDMDIAIEVEIPVDE